MPTAADRRAQILDGIAAAARPARRDPEDVQLIAVSKDRSADEIEALIDAGQRDFGESRVQEALAKWPPLLARHADVRLHGIGRLQSNKAGEAVRLFDAIHSLDRGSLLDALAREAEKAGRFPAVYVQVNIGEEEQKGGCAIAEVGEMVEAVRALAAAARRADGDPAAGIRAGALFRIACEAGAAQASAGSAWACRRITRPR